VFPFALPCPSGHDFRSLTGEWDDDVRVTPRRACVAEDDRETCRGRGRGKANVVWQDERTPRRMRHEYGRARAPETRSGMPRSFTLSPFAPWASLLLARRCSETLPLTWPLPYFICRVLLLVKPSASLPARRGGARQRCFVTAPTICIKHAAKLRRCAERARAGRAGRPGAERAGRPGAPRPLMSRSCWRERDGGAGAQITPRREPAACRWPWARGSGPRCPSPWVPASAWPCRSASVSARGSARRPAASAG